MSSQVAELLGVQTPQIEHRPSDVANLDAAAEALELADLVGMTLDESQAYTLEAALGERSDGSWAAFEVCDVQPRQNGKGDTIQARELAGLFLFDERLIIHTAHEFPTANEAFLRMVALIEANPELRRKVKFRFANGEQAVERVDTGARLKYRARTGGAGRGFAGASLVVYDEAYALQAEQVAASLPTLSTGTNPQVWFASSAGLATSTQLWSLRLRALSGDAGRLAYLEHTAERPVLGDDGVVRSEPVDECDDALVALANPAVGRRISWDYIEAERRAMSGDGGKFARERLGVWDPLPAVEAELSAKLDAAEWTATITASPPAIDPGDVTLTFAVSRDGAWSSVSIAAGPISSPYVETIDHRPEVGWLPGRIVELVERWKPIALGCNGAGATGAQVGPVLAALRDAGLAVDLVQMSAAEYARACEGFRADVAEGRLTRPDDGVLSAAGLDATDRRLGQGWAWETRSSTPICPLDSATVARALLPTERPESSVEPDLLFV